MRFRAKSVLGNWLWLLIFVGNLAMALDRFRNYGHSQLGFFNRSMPFFNLITASMALLVFYSAKTTFWAMDAEGLLFRRLWINTRINWQDVTRIVSMWSGLYDIKIEYSRRGFGPRTGSFRANPEDRDAFLASLRLFAPLAEFVDESRKTILTA